jgi:hypothetical protein
MNEAMKVTSKNDPLNDPEFALGKAVLKEPLETSVSGTAEMDKAIVKDAAVAKEE